MANNNSIGYKILTQSLSKSNIQASFNEIKSMIAKEVGKTDKEIDQAFDNLDFSNDLVKRIVSEFEKAEKELGTKSLTFSKDLFKGLIDANGAEEEINKVVKTYENKIESLVNLRNRIGDDKIFVSIDTTQLDELIEKEERIIELRQEIERLSGEGRSTSGKTKSANTQEKKLNAEIEALKKNLGSLSAGGTGQINVPTINEKDLKLLDKYSKDLDIIERKLKKLNDAANEGELTDAQNKDFIGFFQQYEKLMKESGQKINKEYKNFYDFLIDDPKLKEFANHLKEIASLQEQINKGNTSNISSGAGIGTGVNTKEVEDIKNKISELETKISEMQTKLQNLDGEAFAKMQKDISSLTNKLNDANKELEEFKNNSSNASSQNKEFQDVDSRAENLINTLNKLQSKMNALRMPEKFTDEINFDYVANTPVNDNENYRDVNVLFSELKQTIKEINSLKLLPETEDTQEKLQSLYAIALKLQDAIKGGIKGSDLSDGLRQKMYGFSDEDFKLLSTPVVDRGELYNSLQSEVSSVFRQLEKEFPNLFNDVMSGVREIDGGGINPFSSITDELERIKSAGQSTFDSINVDLMNSKDYVEDLRKALNRIVASNNGRGSKDGLDAMYALKNYPELEQFKDITTKLPEEEFNKFLSTLEKAQPYLDSIGYKIEEIKEDAAELNNQQKQPQPSPAPETPKEQKDLASEQQTLEKLEQAIQAVTTAIAEKIKAIQAEEVQMDLSVNNEIAKLQELESKLTEIKSQFQNGILGKNPDGGDNITLEKDVNLKPTLDADKFKKDAEGLLAHANVEKEVTLKVGELDLNSAQGVSGEQSVTDNITNDNVIEEQNKDLKEQQRLYNNIIKLLAECVSLQDKINAGNRYIVDGNLINSSDIRKQTGKVSQRSVKYQLDNYLRAAKNEYGIYSDNSIKQAKEQLAAYVADFDNAEKAAEIFGNKNKELFNEVSQMIENARVSLDAYNELQLKLSVSDRQLSELNRLQTGENLKMGELWKLEDIVQTDDLDSALKYITDELGIKIPQAAEKAKAAINDVDKEVKNVQDGENGKNNLIPIQIKPEANEEEWFKKINDIIKAINIRKDLTKVQIQPDTSSNEWNEFKTFIKNISDQVIKLNLQMNEDGSVTKKKSTTLPSDLNKSYQNSTKYANELYKIKEQIAKATESNNKKELEKLATLKAQEKEFENLLKLEKDFRASDRFSDFDTSSKDDALNKLITDKQQEYQANRNVAASSLASQMASIEDEAWKANEAYDQNKKLEEVNRLLDLQREKWQEINNIRIKMESESGFDDDQIDLDILEQQKKALMEEVELIQEQLKQYDSLIDKKKESKKLDAITTDANKTINGDRVVDLDQAYNEANKINETLIKTENMMNRFMNGVNRNDSLFGEAFKNAKNDIGELNRQLESGQIGLSQYNKLVNDLKKNLTIQKNAVAIVNPEDISNMDQIREVLNMYMDEATDGTAENLKWNDSARTLTGTFKNQNGEIQNVTTAIKDLNNGTSAVTTSFGKAQKPISNWSKLIDELGVKFRNLATYLASFVGFYEIWGAIRQGVTYVKELDTALTEMKKVSDETTQSLKEFQKASFDIADSVASTAKEIQNSTADWLRLGYAMEDASELARTTAVYKAVGDDMDMSTATESMVSTLQGFQLEADQAANIVDQFNEVSNNFAIDSKGIGDALQRSAASFNAANTGMSEAIALITATMKTKWLNI